MKFRLVVQVLLFFCVTSPLSAQQVSDAFNVRVHDSYIRVIAPRSFHREQSVVIENNTMIKLIGKVQTNHGDVVAYVSVDPGKFQAVEVEVRQEDKIYFIPLSPGLPEAELIVGRKSYEVPPQNKD